MSVKTLDRATLTKLREEIDAAIAPIAKKHGISLHVGNGTFTPSNAVLKVEIATVSTTGDVNTREVSDYKALAKAFGLPVDGIGKTINWNAHTYTIVGLMPRSRKFPVLVKDAKGKLYKLPVIAVERSLSPDPAKRVR